MDTSKTAYLLVNFGGPRNLEEIEEFLIELLTDQEVIRTSFPAFFHRLLFTYVAKKRSKKIAPDYAAIGGRSPIYDDTEAIAAAVSKKLGTEVHTFHRYLPKTHEEFIEKMQDLRGVDRIRVFPMFPQFSYATTGSMALWFSKYLPSEIVAKMQWISSFASHPSYIAALQRCLRDFLRDNKLAEEEIVLLCSAHGLPQRFICTGDVYQQQCQQTFEQLARHFPGALSVLSFQSQFGKEEWIRPYTAEVCANIADWAQGRKEVVVVPLSFVSDHIETLYEIEEIYVSSIRKNGLKAYRCPALNLRSDWMEAIVELFQTGEGASNASLLRKDTGKCCKNPAACKQRFHKGTASISQLGCSR